MVKNISKSKINYNLSSEEIINSKNNVRDISNDNIKNISKSKSNVKIKVANASHVSNARNASNTSNTQNTTNTSIAFIEKLKINWLTTSVIVIYPLFIILMLIYYSMSYDIGKIEVLSAVIAYYLCNISVGLGFHRLWSHSAYKAHPILEFVLMILTAGTLQGPVLAWVSDHKFHHAYADKELDPHTPLKYKNRIKGFLWSHIGWLIFSEGYKRIDKITMKTLGSNKLLMWQFKNYFALAMFINIVVPSVIGYMIGGDIHSAFAVYLFAAAGRALQQQLTFCVNSLCHFTGKRRYANDSSGDIAWLWFMLLGENWHNYHHAFANDYRNGHKWYHLDIHKWLIVFFEKCGLASNLCRVPEERIQAKMLEMQKIKYSNCINKISDVEMIASRIAASARDKITYLEAFILKKDINILKDIKVLKNITGLHDIKKLKDIKEKISLNIKDMTGNIADNLKENLTNFIDKYKDIGDNIKIMDSDKIRNQDGNNVNVMNEKNIVDKDLNLIDLMEDVNNNLKNMSINLKDITHSLKSITNISISGNFQNFKDIIENLKLKLYKLYSIEQLSFNLMCKAQKTHDVTLEASEFITEEFISIINKLSKQLKYIEKNIENIFHIEKNNKFIF